MEKVKTLELKHAQTVEVFQEANIAAEAMGKESKSEAMQEQMAKLQSITKDLSAIDDDGAAGDDSAGNQIAELRARLPSSLRRACN